jgi:integral membrane protein (TIGR01906 family)
MSTLLVQILRVFLVLLIPLVAVLGAVRLVATEPYVAFEYEKFDFPEDAFGFDRAQRLAHAADNLQYVTQGQPVEDLAGQKHASTPLYNERELEHMQDVQRVYQAAWRVWQAALALAVLSGLALAWRPESRLALAAALQTGGALTAGLVVVIGLAVIVAWQVWFAFFHRLFFTAGSWTFDYSNTLIRLFPEKFWYDTALTIASLSLIFGSLVFFGGARFRKGGNGESEQNGDENDCTPQFAPG